MRRYYSYTFGNKAFLPHVINDFITLKKYLFFKLDPYGI